MIPAEITRHLEQKFLTALEKVRNENISDIRIAAQKELAVFFGGSLVALGVFAQNADVRKIIESICGGSLYAVQDKLREGYITLPGGHRVGVCGSAVVRDGAVTHLKDISALSFRISREIKGAASAVMPHITQGGRLLNTLIVSPPCCGKTTLLRDAARILGNLWRVCIIDERGEIAATHCGAAQNDVGRFSFVFDACPKDKGIMMALRAASPDIIVTDELGSAGDEAAVENALISGVALLCTAHGRDERDVRRGGLGHLIERGAFEKIVILSSRKGAGTIERIV